MVKIQGNYCTYRNLTILETLEVWFLSSLGTNENLFSEGLLPGFVSYCTYTRNKILAKKKKMLICWQVVTKSASIPHRKIARKTA